MFFSLGIPADRLASGGCRSSSPSRHCRSAESEPPLILDNLIEIESTHRTGVSTRLGAMLSEVDIMTFARSY